MGRMVGWILPFACAPSPRPSPPMGRGGLFLVDGMVVFVFGLVVDWCFPPRRASPAMSVVVRLGLPRVPLR